VGLISEPCLRSWVLPATEWVTRTRFLSMYWESIRFERQDDGRRNRLRDQRLAIILNAARRSALHRQRLEQTGLDNHPVNSDAARAFLDRLPPVAKHDLRRHFPAGLVTEPASEDWRYFSTAGTTDRMSVVSDFVRRDHRRSGELRSLRVALGRDVGVRTVEIPPQACNVVCGIEEKGPPGFWSYLWHSVRSRTLLTTEALSGLRGRFERQVVMPRNTLAPLPPLPAARLLGLLDRYLDQIAAIKPACLRALPVYLLWLADRLRATGRSLPGLQLLAPFGGLASPRMAKRIAAGAGAPFADLYGTSELGSVAASCGRSPGMHLFEDQFLVEVLRDGRPVPPGEVGRLIVTDLVNSAMPLVRYEVGDVGRILSGPCPCGRRTVRIKALGRIQEVLVTPTGQLMPADVADAVFRDEAVANFQLAEIRPGCFELALVANFSGDAPDLRGCEDRLAVLHGAIRRIRTRLVPFVQPETSGKYLFVIPARREGGTL
jgi:phenylacetate-coenzyme A ligase PaaK-like adenylate-forming protein